MALVQPDLSNHDPESAARGTLALLETRLRRLEFLLTGTTDVRGIPANAGDARRSLERRETVTVAEQLKELELGLDRLRKLPGPSGKIVRDVESLSGKYPEIFPSHLTASLQNLDSQPENQSITASIVLSHAALYPETASRLSSLETLQIPPAEQSVLLVEQGPRLAACQKQSERQSEEVRQLRERSARCLEWWIKVGVVGMGDLWEEWHTRMSQLEREATRAERQWKGREGYV